MSEQRTGRIPRTLSTGSSRIHRSLLVREHSDASRANDGQQYPRIDGTNGRVVLPSLACWRSRGPFVTLGRKTLSARYRISRHYRPSRIAIHRLFGKSAEGAWEVSTTHATHTLEGRRCLPPPEGPFLTAGRKRDKKLERFIRARARAASPVGKHPIYIGARLWRGGIRGMHYYVMTVWSMA